MQFALKVLVSALVVAGSSELAKRHPGAGAVLASLPLASVLALSWLWLETGDASRVGGFSWAILWAVIPSLAFFAALPLLLRAGLGYWASLAASCALTAACYAGWARLATRFGVTL